MTILNCARNTSRLAASGRKILRIFSFADTLFWNPFSEVPKRMVFVEEFRLFLLQIISDNFVIWTLHKNVRFISDHNFRIKIRKWPWNDIQRKETSFGWCKRIFWAKIMVFYSLFSLPQDRYNFISIKWNKISDKIVSFSSFLFFVISVRL